MRSNLNIKEFKKRLTELISEEKGLYLLTPYNSSGKPFCGTFDEKKFELTRNSFWIHVKAIVIKGEYRNLDNKWTDISYEIGWTKFMRNLFIAFNGIVFIGFNTFIILNVNHFDTRLLSILLPVNGVLVFANIWVLTVNWLTKKIVNQRFKEEFEIDVEDEWEKLAKRTVTKSPSS